MKSYNHLFEEVIKYDNIELAIHNAAKKKTNRPDVADVLAHIDYHIRKVQRILITHSLKLRKHTEKQINDGFLKKIRTIVKPDFKYEQIIHHALMQVLIPVFMKGMYEYSCGSIPGRGNFHGKKYIEKIIKKDPVNTRFILKIDIRKFFQNVNKDILKRKLKEKIHDWCIIELLFKIIDTCDHGIPLGYYTSQWFANFYLQELDYFIKQKLRIKYHVRFMDDMSLFASTKEELHYALFAIKMFIKDKLDLELKSNYQIFRLAVDKYDNTRCLDFMGFKFYRNKTILRRNILMRIILKIKRVLKKKYISWYDSVQLMSGYGWIKHTNTFKKFKEIFTDNKIFIKDLKYKISSHQKKVNLLLAMQP